MWGGEEEVEGGVEAERGVGEEEEEGGEGGGGEKKLTEAARGLSVKVDCL